MIGRLYEERKQQGERTDLTSVQNDQKLTTAQEITDEYKVRKATVEHAKNILKLLPQRSILAG